MWLQYPRIADLKDEIAFLKKLGDAFGGDLDIDRTKSCLTLPIARRISVHSQAARVMTWFFAEARVLHASLFLITCLDTKVCQDAPHVGIADTSQSEFVGI